MTQSLAMAQGPTSVFFRRAQQLGLRRDRYLPPLGTLQWLLLMTTFFGLKAKGISAKYPPRICVDDHNMIVNSNICHCKASLWVKERAAVERHLSSTCAAYLATVGKSMVPTLASDRNFLCSAGSSSNSPIRHH